MWGQLIGALMNKGQKDQAEMDKLQSPKLAQTTQGSGFQTAQPQIASGGAGGLLSGIGGMIGGGGGEAGTTAEPAATADLNTTASDIDPLTGQPKGQMSGFNGLKTKLY